MSAVILKSRTTTWVREDTPNAVYWNKTGYLALSDVVGKRKHGYVWFSIPFKRGVRIISATLRLKTRAIGAMTNRTLKVRALKGGLNYTLANWATHRPDPVFWETVTVTKSGALAENTEWAFNVTPTMQAVADGRYWAGFYLESNDPVGLQVQSHLMQSWVVPTLEVTWSDAPLPPDVLSPSSGNGVGTNKPILRFNFEDYSGDESMEACQVQISSSSNFASPAWDSGEWLTSIPQMDLDAAGYPGASHGVPVYWRVRVKDGAGIWSGWSAPTHWSYYPLPTVVWNNPPTSGVVTDPTPPLDWSYTGTGSPQTAYRVGVYVNQGGKWVLTSASGKIAGAGTVWTPTKSIGPNGQYRVIVDVWDARQRESVPGFPSYASAVRDFTYKFSASVASPTNGVATGKDPYPGIVLTWKSATQPDRFVIMRDGKPLADYPGSSLFTSGTSYTITDRAPDPRVIHTYQVVAVQNGVSSQPHTFTGISKPLGSWIVGTESSTMLCVVQDRDRDLTFSENTTVHEVLNSMAPVVITSGMGGYQGTLKGSLRRISGIPTISAREWKQRALDIKSDVGALYWVIIGDEAFKAVLSHVQVFRSADMPNTYQFSAQFYQQDQFSYDPGF